MFTQIFPVLLSRRKWSQTLGNAPAGDERNCPFSGSVKVWNPRPWPNSWRATATKSIPLASWPSNPRYHGLFGRQPAVPILTLNVAVISGLVPGSLPVSALTRATGNQVSKNGAFGKFLVTPTGAADARVPPSTSQGRAAQLARTVIVGPLLSVAPQIFAAVRTAISRCWPRVVPLLPPTGATGVGSLNPVVEESLDTTSTVACPDADDAATRLTASITRKIEGFMRTCLITLLRLVCGLFRFKQLGIDSEESRCRTRTVDAGLCNRAILISTSNSHVLKTTLEVH